MIARKEDAKLLAKDDCLKRSNVKQRQLRFRDDFRRREFF